ncbi:hypothetical protein CVT24_006007 [Panaeolus cyanescens]|uniref:PH domain-containing protein n=1 Tax=Panaeolus cyanescens TaxID=181874 RepID=A0A409YE13_9AGAR|nr:hypothetical protein CVT24_006007 [Panaeolus cyanescens]
MASSGASAMPSMPDFSLNDPFSTAGDMKFHLQNLLDSKEKQLQQAGSLGQRVLAQQIELEERIRQLQELEAHKGEDDEIDHEARERYRELSDTILAWDAENAQLSVVFGGSSSFLTNGHSHSPNMPLSDLPREEPERVKPSSGTTAAQSRRAKNAAHRADDVEFAFEIGSGLLTEVRRLQSLLGERDKAIQDMKEEKDDLEKSVESLRAALRQQTQDAEALKEASWNLEVEFRELKKQSEEGQENHERLQSEHRRLIQSLANARESADHHKNETERLQNQMEDLKNKHETSIAQARKHAAGLARDKADLQQSVDTLKAEIARAGRRINRFSPLTPGGQEPNDFLTPGVRDGDGDSDVFGTTGRGSVNRRNLDVASLFPPDDPNADFPDSPDPSPLRKPFLAANHPSNEIEALQQRLAHAQRQINTLKGSLNREKQQRIRLEAAQNNAAQDNDEQDGDELDDAEEVHAAEEKRPAKKLTPFKVGGRGRGHGRGRGRGRGGITLIQRLGMAAASTEDNDDDDDDSLPPPVPSIPGQFTQLEEDDEVSQFFGSNPGHDLDEERERSPSPPAEQIHSNRTSVDGMDPAFANILRRVPSNGSSYAGSPLRQSILNRSTRGGAVRRPRGGVPFKEARPPSIVDAPEVLAAELGDADTSLLKNLNNSLLNEADVIQEDDDDEYIRVKKVVKVDFTCQTDAIEDEKTVVLPEPPVIPVVPVVPDTPPSPPRVFAEIAIQSEPATPAPKVVTTETSLQTDPEPVVVVHRSDMAIQHSAPEPVVPKPPVLVHTEIMTDPIPEPTTIGRGLPPLVTGETTRRSTLTQADISRSSSVGDTTITRSFLAQPQQEDEGIDEGEETETGAETEDDYHDARQSIMTFTPTPSEDFHSVITMTDNDYSDSEDDAESIKASHFSSRRDHSTTSLNRPETSSSYYPPASLPAVTYEEVGVSADLYVPPEPVVIQAPPPPKPEVKEISIQTDEWKPAPIIVQAPAPVVKPAPTPGLYRVGSSSGPQQFQFIPPTPPSAPPNGQSSTTAPVFTAPSPVPTPLSGSFRDSAFGRRNNASDRRQSIESLISSSTAPAEDLPRSRVPSSSGAILASVDKSKPPVMMALPPPPKAPPPPNSMPPPNFIPERRNLTASSSSDIPPPRPSSPPPAELIQRATTPLGSILSHSGQKLSYGFRQSGSSMPPSQTNLRQPPSTSSFRSAANAATHASMAPPSILSSYMVRENERREFSSTSLVTDHSGVASARSSISSDHHGYNRPTANAPSTPDKTADITPRANAGAQSTDPAIIHAITQTMIGEFLYKYTRKAIGKGVGERRHQRFFWVHPYTKTLYWSSADPGSSNVSESSAKSAYIEGVRSVLDPNPMPPGLYQYSVVVSTPQREMKITAPTKERHDIWLNALKYLLSRPSNNVLSPANMSSMPQTPGSNDQLDDEPRRPPMATLTSPQRQSRSPVRGETWNTTPRGQRSRSQLSVGRSVSKRSGTPALEYLRWNGPESPYSPDRSFVDVPARDPDDLDFELHDESMSDEGFEGLENVRACCDGRHTVGHSGKHHHHHHHHDQGTLRSHHQGTLSSSQNHGTLSSHNQGTLTNRRSADNQHLDPNMFEQVRPSSPAWSFRSGKGSSQSHSEGGGIFSWGRGEDGKLRFGSRRSTKTSIPAGSHDS